MARSGANSLRLRRRQAVAQTVGQTVGQATGTTGRLKSAEVRRWRSAKRS